jgi:2,5-diketo-D-gluconate reductase A
VTFTHRRRREIRPGKVLDDPAIATIAGPAGKSPAQVVLRWHTQRGDVVFPKWVTPGRIKENFDIFDFELSDQDMESISALDAGMRTGPDPCKFDRLPD